MKPKIVIPERLNQFLNTNYSILFETYGGYVVIDKENKVVNTDLTTTYPIGKKIEDFRKFNKLT